MTRFKSVAIASALLIAAPAYGATDGTLGTTSNGTFNVSALISPPPVDNVQVSGLDDIAFIGTTTDISPPEQYMIFCMVRQPGGGNIGVTVSSIAAGDTGFLVRSGGDTIDLFVELQSKSGVFQILTEGVEATFDVPASCDEFNSDEYSRFGVILDEGANPEFPAGNFSNTFLISIAPK